MKLICWNMGYKIASWECLAANEVQADVALVQEACTPPAHLGSHVVIGPEDHWNPETWNGGWWKGLFPKLCDHRTMVVKLSDRVQVEWFKQVGPISGVTEDMIAVSGICTIAAARVVPLDAGAEPFIAVSMYAQWNKPHPSTRSKWSYTDGSAHRIISDLSAFIGNADPSTHRILAAGDLNLIYDGKTGCPQDLDERNSGVFERMKTIGLELIGPRYPAGRKATPTPNYLPPCTNNVPTFHTWAETPATASRQLDYVFASRGFHEQVRASALNKEAQWGPSDHCRVMIEVSDTGMSPPA